MWEGRCLACAYQSCPTTKSAQNIVPCAAQYIGHAHLQSQGWQKTVSWYPDQNMGPVALVVSEMLKVTEISDIRYFENQKYTQTSMDVGECR